MGRRIPAALLAAVAAVLFIPSVCAAQPVPPNLPAVEFSAFGRGAEGPEVDPELRDTLLGLVVDCVGYVLEDRFETEGGLWLAPTRALLWGCLNFEGRVSNHVDTSGQLDVLALLDVLGTGQLDIAASADSARVTPKQAACYAYVSVADYAWLAMREAARRFVTRVTFDRCAY